jgi:hypothetical protein
MGVIASLMPSPAIVMITAPIMTIVNPIAASGVRPFLMRNNPGRTSPKPPNTSHLHQFVVRNYQLRAAGKQEQERQQYLNNPE